MENSARTILLFLLVFFLLSEGVPQQESTSLSIAGTDTIDRIEQLKRQVEFLQQQLEVRASPERGDSIDLSGEEFESLHQPVGAHVLARPWYGNIDMSGFGGMGFLATGKRGTRPHGGFLIKEASLFLEGDAWTDATLYIEVQFNRLGEDSTMFVRTGEVYAHFRNVLRKWGDNLLGIKVGRIDLPFGEEYLWQDASDNPLISNSAAYPYGWDEGVLFYGRLRGIGWFLAITDGTNRRSVEDHPAKAVNAKFFGKLLKSLYLSASFMTNGVTEKSAIEFGGSHFEPVGSNHVSSAGSSQSQEVDAALFMLDAKYGFGVPTRARYVALSYGKAFLRDHIPSFNRDWMWFSVESLFSIGTTIYSVLRYSEIGTYDSARGYHFNGKITAGGITAYGYDTKRFKRISLGGGWRPNPRVIVKVEVGHDWFELIHSSPFDPANGKRGLFGIELVMII